MEDIIKYHVVGLVPIEFLDVAKWTQAIALKHLSHKDVQRHYRSYYYYLERIKCRYGRYYSIVRLLGSAMMYTELSTFTDIFFDEVYFGIRVWRLLQAGDHAAVYALYEYIKYHHGRAAGPMLNIFTSRFEIEDIENIRHACSDIQYEWLREYYDVAALYGPNPTIHSWIEYHTKKKPWQ
ncbi:hypothetical protein F-LCD7_0017 [Faustovirus]|nr:hypothetical protein F-LCD7_0017 [Faustovirus]